MMNLSTSTQHEFWSWVEHGLTARKAAIAVLSLIGLIFLAGYGLKGAVQRYVAPPGSVVGVRQELLDSLSSARLSRQALQNDVDSLGISIVSTARLNSEIVRKLDYLICRDGGGTIEDCSRQARGF